jgi:hypothetical protein
MTNVEPFEEIMSQLSHWHQNETAGKSGAHAQAEKWNKISQDLER